MLDPEIRAMMRQDVFLSPCLGRTAKGDPQFARPVVSVRARVEPRIEFIRAGANGEDLNSTHVIITADKIPEGAKVWVLGADINVREQGRIVQSVETMIDEDGSVSHYEVLI